MLILLLILILVVGMWLRSTSEYHVLFNSYVVVIVVVVAVDTVLFLSFISSFIERDSGLQYHVLLNSHAVVVVVVVAAVVAVDAVLL